MQIYLGILLLTVILFQTMSVMYEDKLQRRLVLFDTDQLRRKLTAAITKQ
ncbi:MAG: hypothetical protein ACI9K8_000238 [Reinekea sp.]